MDRIKEYWQSQGLDRLVAVYSDPDTADPFHATSGKATVAFEPQISDLVRLHRLVMDRMATTVLEFGVGFSTLVLADALAKNKHASTVLLIARPYETRSCFNCSA